MGPKEYWIELLREGQEGCLEERAAEIEERRSCAAAEKYRSRVEKIGDSRKKNRAWLSSNRTLRSRNQILLWRKTEAEDENQKQLRKQQKKNATSSRQQNFRSRKNRKQLCKQEKEKAEAAENKTAAATEIGNSCSKLIGRKS
ncbi:hypothetical protein M9H77_17386 [Catharanthus roseus]|uniref:Uncharacterized protein n=1 Tax=Catharanthus roseus TaxID=4058 RepID=A0ACC0B4G7_CATRO|nr:hypothetical protein M9H77_17386 [Catharanthus roseus]